MKSLKLAGAALILAAAVTPAFAATGISSQTFAEKAAVSNQFEIDSSKIALEKSQNNDVKTFAQQMIDDHGKADSDFKTALSSSKVDASKVPTSLDDKHQKIVDRLNTESGATFDKDYIKAQTDAHKEAVSLFSTYSKTGKDDSLKTFATNTLPTLQQHLDHVKELKASK